MSKTKIVTIICWSVSALVLIGLLAWFLINSVFGGWGMFTNSDSGFNIFGMNFGGFENLTGPFEVQGVKNESTTDIHSIDINWVAGEITVVPHFGDDIQITESAQRRLNDNERMKVTSNGGTLKVEFRERGSLRGNMPRKNLEVLVPYELSENLTLLSVNTTSGKINISEFEAATLDISSVSASIDISAIVSNSIDLSTTSGAIRGNTVRAGIYDVSTVSGSINLSEANVPTLDLSTTSGSMTVSGEFDKINTSTVSGSVNIRSNTLPSRIDSSSVSGGVVVYLPNDGEITVSHSAVSGRFSSDIPVKMQGGAAYNFSSVSGSTNIYALG